MPRACLAALMLVLTMAARPAAASDIIVQISDTHVSAVDPAVARNNAALQAWVDDVNALPLPPVFTVNTGDLVDDTRTAATRASFDLYMRTVAGLRVPHLVAPGNHDYQGPLPYGFAAHGYDPYPTAAAGGLWLVGSNVTVAGPLDFDRLAANLRAGRGRYPAVVLQHYPFNAPAWLSCNGQPCRAPRWLLTESDQARLRALAAEYDVIAFLAGHVHATYASYDKGGGFQTINAPALGNQGAYLALTLAGERLAVGQVRTGRPGPIITAPPYFDLDSGLGQLFEPGPVQAVAYGRPATGMRLRVGSAQSPWFPMQPDNAGEGWTGAYNWAGLRAGVSYQLTVEATYADGSVAATTQVVRRAATFPNGPAQIRADPSGLAGQVLSDPTRLQFALADAEGDLARAELFIDGVRRQSWSLGARAAADLDYPWAAEQEPAGEHTVYVKVTDRYGRVVRSPRVFLATGPAATPVSPTPTGLVATPTPSATETPTATPPTAQTPATCAPGVLTLAPTWDSYLFAPGAAKAGDADPANAPLLRNSDGWPYYRSLLYFDLAGIPEQATITSARLALQIHDWYPATAGARPVATLHWLARPAGPQATWTAAAGGQPWAQPGASGPAEQMDAGGDYLMPGFSHSLTWGANIFDLTAFLAAGRSHPNYGLRVSVTGSGATFYASETAAYAPQLIVTYACP